MGKTDDFAVAIDDQQQHDSHPPPHQDEAGRGMRQDEYMMFIDDNHLPPPTINEDPVPPPTYQEARESDGFDTSEEHRPTTRDVSSNQASAPSSSRIPTPPLLTPLHFHKGTGLSSKARLTSPNANDTNNNNGRSFLLIADIHKSSSSPSTIRLYSSSSSSSSSSSNNNNNNNTTCLGTILFPPTDNSFQLLMSPDGGSGSEKEQTLLQVRARIGNPDVTSFTFCLPGTSRSGAKGREVVWTRVVPAGNGKGGGYDLVDATYKTPLAKWRFVRGEKYDVELTFAAAAAAGNSNDIVRSEAEYIAIVLSFIGCMSRLKLKGKDMSGLPRGGRWGAFWFMAVLGTAGVDGI